MEIKKNELLFLENVADMFLDIGKIIMSSQRAMDFRFHLKELIKETGHDVESSRKERSIFGSYEDCGEFYESSYNQALGREEGVVMFKKQIERMEKYTKKLKHEFKEKYPAICVQYLEQELLKNTQETYKYLSKKLKK